MLTRRLSTSPPGPEPAPDILAGLGAELHEARVATGGDLHEIAESLRIKAAYLDALERGDGAALPAGPYALGFLKGYAEHLDLDPAPLVARLKAARRAMPVPIMALPEAPAEGRRPAIAILVAALLLVGGLYGGYRLIGGGVPPPAEIVALPPELPPVPPTAAPPEPVAAAPVAPAATPDPGSPAEPAGDVTAALAAESSEPSPASVRVAALDVDSAPPADLAEVPIVGRVVLLARESSWVQVRSAARDYVRTRTMQPGERFALPDRADLALWTGNAGGLELLVDGQSVGRAGEMGAVVRDLPLTPEGLQQRAPAPTP